MTLLFSLILNSLFIIPSSVYAASSPWTQTDWSGGVGASTTNQYSAASSTDATTTSGQITLTNTEKFSNTGFESNLTGWNTGVQPDSISGLQVWFKTDAIMGLSDGDAVTTWTDSSGNSRDATQATTDKKPVYKTNIVNGQPIIRFDGTNDLLETANFARSTPQHIFTVFKMTDDNNNQSVYDIGGGVINTLRLFRCAGGCGWPNLTAYSGAGLTISPTLILGSFGISTVLFNGANSEISLNGGTATSGSTGGTSSNFGITLGNHSGTSGFTSPLNGDIAEVIMYNVALSTSDRQSVEAYLQGKYGISAGYATLTRDTATTYSSSAGSAKLVNGASAQNFTQTVNVGDTNTYNLVTYAKTDGSAVTSSDVSLFYNGSTISTTYTSVGSGWYQLTGTITGANASRVYGVQVAANKTVYVDNFSLNSYASSGTLTSSIFDTEFAAGAAWGTLTYNATTPANTSVSVKARTSNSSSMTGATAFSSCTAITSGSDISSNSCVTDSHRYIQYQLSLANTDSVSTPTFQDVSIAFAAYDATAPTISLTALATDPNSDNTPTLSGTATEGIGNCF